MRPRLLLHLVVAAALIAPAAAAELVVRGRITGDDHQTYREVPFEVPPGTSRVTVTFAYDRTQGTVVDLGVADPDRFRGWSGGAKTQFTLAATDASPGYLPGPIPPGRWHLWLGVPNARPAARTEYTATIAFDQGADRAASIAAQAPARSGPGWYRGDLHMHTAHSDGRCLSQAGVSVGCPLYRTVEAAAAAGLDFIAVSDHNTVAHFDAIRELEPYFDRMVLIPGVEITTFHGHANIFAPSGFVDFRLGSAAVPTFAALADRVAASGAVLSINHPGLPSGERCMGCGWTVADTDYDRVQAVEAVNGVRAEGPGSGLAFWYARLNQGYRLAGIGGSDNHNGTAQQPPVGRPTTVVYAPGLSVAGIVQGLRNGRIFIDVEGSDRLLDLAASRGASHATMGETLAGVGPLVLTTHVKAPAGARIELIVNGKPLAKQTRTIAVGDDVVTMGLSNPPRCGWMTANVRSAEGTLLIVGNPIYIGDRCGERSSDRSARRPA